MDITERGTLLYPPTSSSASVANQRVSIDGGPGALWVRTPVDDTHTWQVRIEMIPSERHSPYQAAEQPEVLYLTAES
jgi:hypothetical protein